MITLTGVKVQAERAMLLDFTNFVLARFVTPELLHKSRIRIKFVDRSSLSKADAIELAESAAWMADEGKIHGKRQFTVTIDKACINSRAKALVKQFKKPLQYLAHELIHVKQYILGEMIDIGRGDKKVNYKGRVHTVPNIEVMNWDYYDSPWEVEAYGRMEACYAMYLVKLENDQK
jgi:hypothetical protein